MDSQQRDLRIRQLETEIAAANLLRKNLNDQFREVLRLTGEATERLRNAQVEYNRLWSERHYESTKYSSGSDE